MQGITITEAERLGRMDCWGCKVEEGGGAGSSSSSRRASLTIERVAEDGGGHIAVTGLRKALVHVVRAIRLLVEVVSPAHLRHEDVLGDRKSVV